MAVILIYFCFYLIKLDFDICFYFLCVVTYFFHCQVCQNLCLLERKMFTIGKKNKKMMSEL